MDPFTGYRLYEYSQLSTLNRILALEEIGRLLDDGLSVEQMRGMLRLRETEARQRVREEAERLERIEAKNGSQTDPDTVTEIQFPVEKA